MSAPDLMPKLPGDVRAVLDLERDLPAIDDAVQQRLRRRLEASVGILALGVGTAAVTSTAAGGAAATVTKASLVAKPWIAVAFAFVLGGVAGAGLYAAARKPVTSPPQVTTVVVERRVEVPVPAPPPSAVIVLPSTVDTTSPTIAAGSPPPVAVGVAPPAQMGAAAAKSGNAASTTDTGLAAERALLEVARTALSRGDAASALTSLDEHAKRFPGGQLTEEREALYVQALARAGHLSEAKARAARFAKRFPESMLLPVVEAATE